MMALGRNRGKGGGGAALEESLSGWATPAAARLRFKTESRGARAGCLLDKNLLWIVSNFCISDLGTDNPD